MTHTLTQAALRNRFTRLTFATLDKHATSAQGIDGNAALRLLRRNVRDVAPLADSETQQAVARALLTHWRETRTLRALEQE